jgi:hypothetical protein
MLEIVDLLVKQRLFEINTGFRVRANLVPVSRWDETNRAVIAALFELDVVLGYREPSPLATGVMPTAEEIDRSVTRAVKNCFTAAVRRSDYEATRWVNSGLTIQESVEKILNGAIVPFKELHNPVSWAMTAVIVSAFGEKPDSKK